MSTTLHKATPCKRLKLWQIRSIHHSAIMTSCLTESDLNDTMLQPAHQCELNPLRVFQQLAEAFSHDSIVARRVGKRLDQRYKKSLADLDCLRTPEAITRYWNQKVQLGRTQEAYWAVITHPRTTESLREEATQEMQICLMRTRLTAQSAEQEVTELRKELSTTRTQAYGKIIQLEAQLRAASRQGNPSPHTLSRSEKPDHTRQLQNRLDAIEKLNREQAQKIKDLIAQRQASENIKQIMPSHDRDNISPEQPQHRPHQSSFKSGLKTVLKTARTHYAF